MYFNVSDKFLRKISLLISTFAFCFCFFGAENVRAQNAPSKAELLERLGVKNFDELLGGCPAQPISFGQTINGSLATGDCTDDQTGQLSDVYLFSAAAGTQMSSDFSSAQFDTILFLFDLTGNLIAFNDNQSSTTTNSRIPPTGSLTLPSTNQYLLIATSLNPAARGNYTINLLGGTSCSYTLNPTSQNFTAAGGNGSFSVTASSSSCAWQAQSNAAFVTTSSTGTGNGTVNFTVAPNTTPQARGAFITIGQQSFSVQQTGLDCTYFTAPETIEPSAYGGQFSFTLQVSNAQCATNLTSSPWITIQNPNGTGTRTINATATLNNSYGVRSGVITVTGAGRQFDVTQKGRKAAFDFQSGNQANLSLYRPNGGLWIVKFNNVVTGEPSPNNAINAFGLATDKPVPADYDGDGIFDYAVFRDGNWYIIQSRNSTFRAELFGQAGDKPLAADYDGDGRADINVFRPSNGNWFRIDSSTGTFQRTLFGIAEDKPLLADFNGDGKNDVAVYRPSGGAWYWLDSASGAFNAVSFGIASDIPVPADYDGDAKTDIAVFRSGNWYRLNSSNGQFAAFNFGTAGDIPVPADYDIDLKADHAVFRPSDGTWYRIRSGSNFFDAWTFGTNGDIPLPSVYQ